ncbi:hypothetical protein TRVA0_077S00276 [Trichomonascus vanleenenianus]|uniref:uncharacterized protein n=1 Tax=Trichomonascus vanleenenianus TaxID=2268995 RepID=UPI003ECB734A
MKFTTLSIAAIAGAAVADISTQTQYVTSTDVEATTEIQTITHCKDNACDHTPTVPALPTTTSETIEYETKTTWITVGTEVIETVTVCPLTRTHPVAPAQSSPAPQEYETKTTYITVGTEVIETITVCPLTRTTPGAPAQTTPAAAVTTPAAPVSSAPQEYETKTTFITVGTEVIQTVTVCPLTKTTAPVAVASTPVAPVSSAPVVPVSSAPVAPVAPVSSAPVAPFNNQTVPLNTAGTSVLPVASSVGFNATTPTTFQPSQPGVAQPTAPAETTGISEVNGAGKAAFGYSMLALAAAVALF